MSWGWGTVTSGAALWVQDTPALKTNLSPASRKALIYQTGKTVGGGRSHQSLRLSHLQRAVLDSFFFFKYRGLNSGALSY